jgi:hypothetical protein
MVKIGTYMEKPTLTLLRSADDRYGFSFGIQKAKLILEHIEEIKSFVATEEAKEKDNA